MLTWLVLLAMPIATKAWERGKVETFATLPPGEAHPEGIAVDQKGNVYVVTVAANKPRTSEGTLLVFDPQGKHLRSVGIKGSSRLLLEVAFHPRTGQLLVVDYGAGKVLSVDPRTGTSSVFMTVTGKQPGLDGMTFDGAGNVYVTDAHQGIIWKVGPDGGEAAAWSAAHCSSRRGYRQPSARTVWRSTTRRRRCSSPTRRTTPLSRYL
jgi:sugar lactone lactonase YvrE